MQELFRVEDVYGYGTPVVTIQAIDTEGRQVQLEVPTSAADDLHPGMVLVLQWWAASVPRVALDEDSVGTENTVVPPSRSAARPEEKIAAGAAGETNESAIDQDRADKEFRALIGLA